MLLDSLVIPGLLLFAEASPNTLGVVGDYAAILTALVKKRF
jgi:hypothetical protein